MPKHAFAYHQPDRDQVLRPEFDDPDNHDSCCAVGRAQRIINNALTSL